MYVCPTYMTSHPPFPPYTRCTYINAQARRRRRGTITGARLPITERRQPCPDPDPFPAPTSTIGAAAAAAAAPIFVPCDDDAGRGFRGAAALPAGAAAGGT